MGVIEVKGRGQVKTEGKAGMCQNTVLTPLSENPNQTFQTPTKPRTWTQYALRPMFSHSDIFVVYLWTQFGLSFGLSTSVCFPIT